MNTTPNHVLLTLYDYLEHEDRGRLASCSGRFYSIYMSYLNQFILRDVEPVIRESGLKINSSVARGQRLLTGDYRQGEFEKYKYDDYVVDGQGILCIDRREYIYPNGSVTVDKYYVEEPSEYWDPFEYGYMVIRNDKGIDLSITDMDKYSPSKVSVGLVDARNEDPSGDSYAIFGAESSSFRVLHDRFLIHIYKDPEIKECVFEIYLMPELNLLFEASIECNMTYISPYQVDVDMDEDLRYLRVKDAHHCTIWRDYSKAAGDFFNKVEYVNISKRLRLVPSIT